MYIYMGLSDELCGLVQKFQDHFGYSVYSDMAQPLTRQLPGFSAGWRNGLPFSSNLLEITFSSK